MNADGDGRAAGDAPRRGELRALLPPRRPAHRLRLELGDPKGRNFDLYLVNDDGTGLERITDERRRSTASPCSRPTGRSSSSPRTGTRAGPGRRTSSSRTGSSSGGLRCPHLPAPTRELEPGARRGREVPVSPPDERHVPRDRRLGQRHRAHLAAVEAAADGVRKQRHPEVRLHRRDDEVPVRALAHDHRLEAAPAAGLEDVPVEGELGAVEHERRALQLAQGDRALARERVARVQDRLELVLHERHRPERVLVGRQHDAAHVELAVHDEGLEVVRSLLAQLEHDAGVGLVVLREQRREERDPGDRRHPDAQLPAPELRQLRDLLLDAAERVEDALRPLQHDLAGVGERHAPPLAEEQRRAELLLQRLHHLADRRLGHVQRLARAREAALPRHLDEVPQRLYVHRPPPCTLGMPYGYRGDEHNAFPSCMALR